MPDDELRRQQDREKFRAQQARDRSRGKENNERGMQFHYGMAERRGETRENGWVREHTEYGLGADGKDSRRIDQARLINAQSREFSEYKSGRVDGDAKTLKQLELDRELLTSGRYVSGQWITVEGGQLSKEVREKLQALERDFEGRFRHLVVSATEAQKAVDLGKTLTRNLQIELPGVRSLALEQQAISKEREKERTQQQVRDWQAAREKEAREKQRLALTIEKHWARQEKKAQAAEKRMEREARERADRETRDRILAERKRGVARVVENNTRQIEAAREQGKVFSSRELRDAHRDVVRTMRKVRQAEKAQTREMLRGIGVTGQDAKTMQRTLAEGRERNRTDLNRGIDAIGAAVAVSAEVEAREKKERELQQVLERKHQEKQARTVAELDRAVQRGEMSPQERAGYQAVVDSRSRDVTAAEQRRYDRERAEEKRIKTIEAPGVERGPRER